ncbi:MAG TPA: YbaB/EbfC family nucleoid-associated protein [bacterium]|nr:YbaB/EbfC family nucleoid-associated protein [bacterium]
MLSQLKDLYQLQSKAKEIQSKLANETITVEEQGISLTMNGSQEITNLSLPENLNKEDLEKNLPHIFNSAIKKVQTLMAKMMMG